MVVFKDKEPRKMKTTMDWIQEEKLRSLMRLPSKFKRRNPL
jgi:hypothetical protein